MTLRSARLPQQPGPDPPAPCARWRGNRCPADARHRDHRRPAVSATFCLREFPPFFFLDFVTLPCVRFLRGPNTVIIAIAAGCCCTPAKKYSRYVQQVPDGDLTEPAVLVEYLVPYPQDAALRGDEGEVTLALRVNADGGTEDVRVLCGPTPSLRSAAREALSHFTFRPAHEDGGPVDKHITYRYTFLIGNVAGPSFKRCPRNPPMPDGEGAMTGDAGE